MIKINHKNNSLDDVTDSKGEMVELIFNADYYKIID